MNLTVSPPRLFFLFIFIVSLESCALDKKHRESKEEFLISEVQLIEIFGRQHSFEVTKQGPYSYVVELKFNKTSPTQHWVYQISTAEAGTYLDPERLVNERSNDRKNQNKQQLERSYPNIGSGAQRSLLGFGPGGSGEKLVFVTKDKALDFQILFSSVLPSSVHAPNVDIEDVARFLNNLYVNR